MRDMIQIKINSESTNTELKIALLESYLCIDKLLALASQYETLIKVMQTKNYEAQEIYKQINNNIINLYKQIGYDGE